jgi:hypothetical protein
MSMAGIMPNKRLFITRNMKTKQIIATGLLMVCFCTSGYSQVHRPVMQRPMHNTQRPNRAHAGERIHAIKVAYVTDRLHFTSDQSSRFWPVYNRYEQDVRSARKQFVEKYAKTSPGQADDATSRQFIDDNLDYQQEVLNIRRKYNDEFLKVLSPQQVMQLYKTEREFNQLLIQQLKEKQNNRNIENNNTTQETTPQTEY